MSSAAKVKRTYSLEPKTVVLIEKLARETRRDFSAIVDLAVEYFAKSEDARVGKSKAETVDLMVEAAVA